MKKELIFSLLSLLVISLNAQVRYLEEVFTNVKVTPDKTYGVNATILYLNLLGEAIPEQLKLDVYEPEGDTETERPLVILLHSGNFFPPQYNGGCGGTRKDADIVKLANRLARMGYVVASADYRLGWDPTNTSQTARVYTFINAVYRGVQDARTSVRFFKKGAADEGNPYGIDPNKIVLWGNGTAGFISYAAATLDTIIDTYLPKFVTPQGPMVLDFLSGNVDGTSFGVNPGIPGLPFPTGDTLCYANHVGYNSNFQLGVALGGALPDISWIDPNDPPMLGMQVKTDPYIPCDSDLFPGNLLPFFGYLEVSGSCASIPIFNSVGANNIINHPFTDPISIHAASINGNQAGFYPFFTSDFSEGSPWHFTASLEPYGVAGSNCDTNSVAANLYLDTIIQYFAPRACLALDLGCFNNEPSRSLELLDKEVELVISPNPSAGEVRFKTNYKFPMESIYLYDLQGRLVKAVKDIEVSQFTMQRNGLVPGTYLAKVMFKNGFVTKQVMFN